MLKLRLWLNCGANHGASLLLTRAAVPASVYAKPNSTFCCSCRVISPAALDLRFYTWFPIFDELAELKAQNRFFLRCPFHVF